MFVRVASLVPSATESLYALGLGDDVVAVTHECDFPPEAADRPHLTRSVIPAGPSAAEIDAAVRERTESGQALYELDEELLEELEPDLIVTQAVCAVCAVSFDEVRATAAELPSQPRVLSMDPSTLGEVLESIRSLGEAADAEEAARALVEQAADRIDRVRRAVEGEPRPRVAALEWLDPVFVGGHWVPAMIELAGGEDALGLAGERSRTADRRELEASGAEIVVAMPCGYDAERSALEARRHADQIARLGARRVVAVDAAAFFSRPGPRLIDGIELLAHVLHPGSVKAPEADRLVEL